jgi:hypothetical protein
MLVVMVVLGLIAGATGVDVVKDMTGLVTDPGNFVTIREET